MLQFQAPRRVVAKQEHEGEWWAQVEGSNTGVLLAELSVVEKAVDQPLQRTTTSPPVRPTPPIFAALPPVCRCASSPAIP